MRPTQRLLVQDPQAFINDMASIFDGLDLTDIAAHTSEIMQSMMEKIRNHQVIASVLCLCMSFIMHLATVKT